MEEKHAIVMASFTAVTFLAAVGINQVFFRRAPKRLVDSIRGGGIGLKCFESEESQIVISETADQDHQDEETCSVISQPSSKAPSIGIADCNYETTEKNLVELREKEKAKEKEELERLGSCMKELEGRIMKLSLQEGEIIELKKRVKKDEEKLEKLNLQEVEIIELKKKIENDENMIQQLQEQVAMLRDKNKNKKTWWNKGASVHDEVVPVYGSKNKLR